MTYALIGDQFPLKKRGWAIGLLVSGGMAAFIIVAPLSGLIAGLAGWRSSALLVHNTRFISLRGSEFNLYSFESA